MADKITTLHGADVSRIDTLIRHTRQFLRSSWLTTGVGLTLGFTCSTLVVAALVDLLVPLPVPLRIVSFLLVVVPTLLSFFAGIIRPAVRSLSDREMARRIERRVPELQSRLVTTMDLAWHEVPPPSESFFRELIRETQDRLKSFRPGALVDRSRLANSWRFASIAVLAIVLLGLVFGDRVPTTLARILAPLADIPPATGVRFVADPGNTRILKGDDLTISALVEKGHLETLHLEYRGSDGKWGSQPMASAAPDRFSLTVEGMKDSIEYRLVGGGTWTTKHIVQVLDRPIVVDLHTVVHFPPYMALPDPVIGPAQNADATGPVGSDVEVVVEVSGDVTSGELQLLKPVTNSRPVAERKERVWFESALPPGAGPDGNWQWDHSLKFRAAHTEPTQAGPHGHGFHGARGPFEVQPGDHLYTYVYLVPGQVPEQVMLQWHDGANWEHRAFWGADKIQAGSPNSPSRFFAGELPSSGNWVLLDAPARAVGLEGKKVVGMMFTLFGGQAKFNRAGAIDPPAIIEKSYLVEWRYPLQQSDSELNSAQERVSVWSGHIPLTHDAQYRVELRNEIGYTNKELREGRLTAIPDEPPQVALERPGTDLVVSEARKIPLVIRAYDDFGLSDVALAIQRGDSSGFVGSPVQVFEKPVRNQMILAALESGEFLRNPGDVLRYRVQARDRKGQIAQTKEFSVRLAKDPNAADQQVASIEKQYQSLIEKLDQLSEQQAKITEGARAIESSAGSTQKPPSPGEPVRPAGTDAAKADAVNQAKPSPQEKESKPNVAAPQPADAARIREELVALASRQESNAQLGQQIQGAITQAADLSSKSQLVPNQLAMQMHQAEELFRSSALRPLNELAAQMRTAAQANSRPEVGAMAEASERLEFQLAAMRARLEALAEAQAGMRTDPAAAMAQLDQELLRQNAGSTSQELSELRDFLDRLRSEMKMLEEKENLLLQQTQNAPAKLLPKIDEEQSRVEADARPLLARAKRALEQDIRERMPNATPTPAPEKSTGPPERRTPTSPRRSGLSKADLAEMVGPTKDSGVNQPKNAPKKSPAARSAPTATGNSREDSQTTNPSAQAGKDTESGEASDPINAMRSQLTRREQQTADQLAQAQRQIQPQSDELGQLLDELREALGADGDEVDPEVARILNSPAMQRAAQLAQALANTARQSTPDSSLQPNPAQGAENLAGLRTGRLLASQPDGMDLTTEGLVLKMQPRIREELLRGMGEDGPVAYRKFIQDYFNRLTRVKVSTK